MSDRIDDRLSALRSGVRTSVQPAPPAALRVLAERQQRNRRATVATLAAVAVVAVTAAVFSAGRPVATSPLPPGDPSASPEVTGTPYPSFPPPTPPALTTVPADDPMRSVSWPNATINLSGGGSNCPDGRVTFTPESNGIASFTPGYPRAYVVPSEIALGDLTGDGSAEAVLEVYCHLTEEDSGDGGSRLVIVGRDEQGELTSLAWVGPKMTDYSTFWITDGKLFADGYSRFGTWSYRLGTVLGFERRGDEFKAFDTEAHYPPLLPSGHGRWLDLSPIAGQLTCHGLPIPAQLRPAFDAEGLARATQGIGQAAQPEWMVGPLTEPRGEPLWLELDRPGRPYLMVPIGCVPSDTDAQPARALVLFDYAPDGWRAIAAINETDGYFTYFTVAGNTVVVTEQRGETSAELTYRWNGTAFERS